MLSSKSKPLAGLQGVGAFTLIELLIVVIIVGILAAAAVPLYLTQADRARTAEALAGLGAIRSMQQAHRVESGNFVAVASPNIANDPTAANPGLGLDFSDNAYFDNACFIVATGVTIDGTEYDYVATAHGGIAANAAPRSGEVENIAIQMNNRGQVRYHYGSGATLPANDHADWTNWQ